MSSDICALPQLRIVPEVCAWGWYAVCACTQLGLRRIKSAANAVCVLSAIYPFGISSSNEVPNARRDTKKVITINPIIRRMPIPAMAKIGRAKKG